MYFLSFGVKGLRKAVELPNKPESLLPPAMQCPLVQRRFLRLSLLCEGRGYFKLLFSEDCASVSSVGRPACRSVGSSVSRFLFVCGSRRLLLGSSVGSSVG